ncbi:hypothetical protein XCR_2402 [Xanthomonas campestris pv. raphani 756C]|nr:hypothetical protein XCR_2402 [Xanthomonas campestris pv. raphani 756C]
MHGPSFRFWRHRYQRLGGKAPEMPAVGTSVPGDTCVRAAGDGR